MHESTRLAALRRPMFLVLLAFGVAVPWIGITPAWQGIALVVLINACVALGMTLLFGHGGLFSLTQAGLMGIGAYTTANVSVNLGWSPWLGLVLGIVVAMILAAVIGYPILRLQGLYLAMATIAVNLILVVLAREWEPITGGALGFPGLVPVELFGIALVDARGLYYPALAAFLVLFFLAYRLITSPVGAMLAALRHDERATALAGIPVAALKTKLFVTSAGFAAVGGFFLAQYYLFVPIESFGIYSSLLFLIMVVVGGMRSLTGALVGAAFITVVPQLTPNDPTLQQFVFAIAFLGIAMFAPSGIVGVVTGAVARLLGRRAPAPAPAGDVPPVSVPERSVDDVRS